MCPKELRTKQILAPIKFLVQKNCVSKQILGTNGPKTLGVQKYFGPKICRLKRNFGPQKKFQPQKFVSKNFLSPKKTLVVKKFGPKEIVGPKFLGLAN